MSDKRKLQGEMDRCFKKIVEGVEAFDDTFKKLQHANNTNQKDKYDSDLKKEIKKLQRHRDQIKSWASSNDVKDKKMLLDYRKMIETRMERFKVAEKETKTKAYSKEGLGLATKVDPVQKAKDDTMQWLQVTIDAINRQVELFESEIESFNSHSRKKKALREKQDRLEDLKKLLEKHRKHVKNLETLMRMLDNQTIQPDKINVIRDDVEYYLEACQEPDYEDNEFMYEDMGLDESLSHNAVASAASPVDRQLNNSVSSQPREDEEVQLNENTAGNSVDHTNCKEESGRKRNSSDDFVSPHKPSNPSTQKSAQSRTAITFPPLSTTSSAKPAPKSLFTTPVQPYAAAAGGMQSSNNNPNKQDTCLKTDDTSMQSKTSLPQNEGSVWPLTNHIAPSDVNGCPDLSKDIDSVTARVEALSPLSKSDAVPTSLTSPLTALVSAAIMSPTAASNSNSSIHVKMSRDAHNGQIPLLRSNPNTLTSIAEQALTNHGLREHISISSPFSQSTTDSLSTAPLQTPGSLLTQQQDCNKPTSEATGEAKIKPFLGVAPLGPMVLAKRQQYQHSKLEGCWRHMPHPSDSERLRHYLPRNMCSTPSYYPQVPMSEHDSFDFYLRLSTETLFFIFYYMEATKAQYMAAKALKKQSWRFHTKYMMWFQRHEEPKTITDEYEQGAYIYFDYEKWIQRKKEGFTFEYRYLEDRELQ